jgi:CheY-like chemotaxis protein
MVLVVEDSDEVRATVAASLRAYGYEVLEARNGLEALAVFEQHPTAIRLLIADVVLPDMPGARVAELLGRLKPAPNRMGLSIRPDS